MSLRVSLALEDHTNDQYIACPVVRALLADLGKPRALVKPITDPRIRGVNQLKAQAPELLDRYGAISDIVVFIVDGDGEDGSPGRGNRLASMQNLLSDCPRREQSLIAVARQELEVWAIWGSRSQLGVPWSEVVNERHPKERFFDPLITEADLRFPGQGRERLLKLSLSQGWRSLATGCPELAQLQEDFKRMLSM